MSVNPDGSPGNVAAGELVESAWGNAVVNSLAHATIEFTAPTPVKLMIESRRAVYTTDYYGDFTVAFPNAFASVNVTVLLTNGDPANPRFYHLRSVNSTSMAVYAAMQDGSPARNLTCNMSWLAIGRRP